MEEFPQDLQWDLHLVIAGGASTSRSPCSPARMLTMRKYSPKSGPGNIYEVFSEIM